MELTSWSQEPMWLLCRGVPSTWKPGRKRQRGLYSPEPLEPWSIPGSPGQRLGPCGSPPGSNWSLVRGGSPGNALRVSDLHPPSSFTQK